MKIEGMGFLSTASIWKLCPHLPSTCQNHEIKILNFNGWFRHVIFIHIISYTNTFFKILEEEVKWFASEFASVLRSFKFWWGLLNTWMLSKTFLYMLKCRVTNILTFRYHIKYINCHHLMCLFLLYIFFYCPLQQFVKGDILCKHFDSKEHKGLEMWGTEKDDNLGFGILEELFCRAPGSVMPLDSWNHGSLGPRHFQKTEPFFTKVGPSW